VNLRSGKFNQSKCYIWNRISLQDILNCNWVRLSFKV
jgi:hypothetical protein